MFNFWYTNQYVPARSEPGLTMTIDLSRIPPNATAQNATTAPGPAYAASAPGAVAVPRGPVSGDVPPGGVPPPNAKVAVLAKISFENVSGTQVRFIGSIYRLSGTKVSLDGRNEADYLAEADKAATEARTASRFEREVKREVIAEGPLETVNSWFSPGEKDTIPLAFYMPSDTYDRVSLDVEVDVAKGSRLEVSDAPRKPPYALPDDTSRGHLIRATWKVKENSAISRLTRGQRYLQNDVRLPAASDGNNDYPTMYAYVSRKEDGNGKHGLDAVYGTQAVIAHGETGL